MQGKALWYVAPGRAELAGQAMRVSIITVQVRTGDDIVPAFETWQPSTPK
jgi:hypothetical protein